MNESSFVPDCCHVRETKSKMSSGLSLLFVWVPGDRLQMEAGSSVTCPGHGGGSALCWDQQQSPGQGFKKEPADEQETCSGD